MERKRLIEKLTKIDHSEKLMKLQIQFQKDIVNESVSLETIKEKRLEIKSVINDLNTQQLEEAGIGGKC